MAKSRSWYDENGDMYSAADIRAAYPQSDRNIASQIISGMSADLPDFKDEWGQPLPHPWIEEEAERRQRRYLDTGIPQQISPTEVWLRNVYNQPFQGPIAPPPPPPEERPWWEKAYNAVHDFFLPPQEDQARRREVENLIKTAAEARDPKKQRKADDFKYAKSIDNDMLYDGFASGVLAKEGDNIYRVRGGKRESLPIASLNLYGEVRPHIYDKPKSLAESLFNYMTPGGIVPEMLGVRMPGMMASMSQKEFDKMARKSPEELAKKGFFAGFEDSFKSTGVLPNISNAIIQGGANLFGAKVNVRGSADKSLDATPGSAYETGQTVGGVGKNIAEALAVTMLTGSPTAGGATMLPEYARGWMSGEETPQSAIAKGVTDLGTGYLGGKAFQALNKSFANQINKLPHTMTVPGSSQTPLPTAIQGMIDDGTIKGLLPAPLSSIPAEMAEVSTRELSKPFWNFVGKSALTNAVIPIPQTGVHLAAEYGKRGQRATPEQAMGEFAMNVALSAALDVGFNLALKNTSGSITDRYSRAKQDVQTSINYIGKVSNRGYTPEQITGKLVSDGAVPRPRTDQDLLDLQDWVSKVLDIQQRSITDASAGIRIDENLRPYLETAGDTYPSGKPPNQSTMTDTPGGKAFTPEYLDDVSNTIAAAYQADKKHPIFGPLKKLFTRGEKFEGWYGSVDGETYTNKGAEKVLDLYQRITDQEDLDGVSPNQILQTLMDAYSGTTAPRYMVDNPFNMQAHERVLRNKLGDESLTAEEVAIMDTMADIERATVTKSMHAALVEQGSDSQQAWETIGEAFGAIARDKETGQLKPYDQGKLLTKIQKKMSDKSPEQIVKTVNDFVGQEVVTYTPPKTQSESGETAPWWTEEDAGRVPTEAKAVAGLLPPSKRADAEQQYKKIMVGPDGVAQVVHDAGPLPSSDQVFTVGGDQQKKLGQGYRMPGEQQRLLQEPPPPITDESRLLPPYIADAAPVLPMPDGTMPTDALTPPRLIPDTPIDPAMQQMLDMGPPATTPDAAPVLPILDKIDPSVQQMLDMGPPKAVPTESPSATATTTETPKTPKTPVADGKKAAADLDPAPRPTKRYSDMNQDELRKNATVGDLSRPIDPDDRVEIEELKKIAGITSLPHTPDTDMDLREQLHYVAMEASQRMSRSRWRDIKGGFDNLSPLNPAYVERVLRMADKYPYILDHTHQLVTDGKPAQRLIDRLSLLESQGVLTKEERAILVDVLQYYQGSSEPTIRSQKAGTGLLQHDISGYRLGDNIVIRDNNPPPYSETGNSQTHVILHELGHWGFQYKLSLRQQFEALSEIAKMPEYTSMRTEYFHAQSMAADLPLADGDNINAQEIFAKEFVRYVASKYSHKNKVLSNMFVRLATSARQAILKMLKMHDNKKILRQYFKQILDLPDPKLHVVLAKTKTVPDVPGSGRRAVEPELSPPTDPNAGQSAAPDASTSPISLASQDGVSIARVSDKAGDFDITITTRPDGKVEVKMPHKTPLVVNSEEAAARWVLKKYPNANIPYAEGSGRVSVVPGKMKKAEDAGDILAKKLEDEYLESIEDDKTLDRIIDRTSKNAPEGTTHRQAEESMKAEMDNTTDAKADNADDVSAAMKLPWQSVKQGIKDGTFPKVNWPQMIERDLVSKPYGAARQAIEHLSGVSKSGVKVAVNKKGDITLSVAANKGSLRDALLGSGIKPGVLKSLFPDNADLGVSKLTIPSEADVVGSSARAMITADAKRDAMKSASLLALTGMVPESDNPDDSNEWIRSSLAFAALGVAGRKLAKSQVLRSSGHLLDRLYAGSSQQAGIRASMGKAGRKASADDVLRTGIARSYTVSETEPSARNNMIDKLYQESQADSKIARHAGQLVDKASLHGGDVRKNKAARVHRELIKGEEVASQYNKKLEFAYNDLQKAARSTEEVALIKAALSERFERNTEADFKGKLSEIAKLNKPSEQVKLIMEESARQELGFTRALTKEQATELHGRLWDKASKLDRILSEYEMAGALADQYNLKIENLDSRLAEVQAEKATYVKKFNEISERINKIRQIKHIKAAQGSSEEVRLGGDEMKSLRKAMEHISKVDLAGVNREIKGLKAAKDALKRSEWMGYTRRWVSADEQPLALDFKPVVPFVTNEGKTDYKAVHALKAKTQQQRFRFGAANHKDRDRFLENWKKEFNAVPHKGEHGEDTGIWEVDAVNKRLEKIDQNGQPVSESHQPPMRVLMKVGKEDVRDAMNYIKSKRQDVINEINLLIKYADTKGSPIDDKMMEKYKMVIQEVAKGPASDSRDAVELMKLLQDVMEVSARFKGTQHTVYALQKLLERSVFPRAPHFFSNKNVQGWRPRNTNDWVRLYTKSMEEAAMKYGTQIGRGYMRAETDRQIAQRQLNGQYDDYYDWLLKERQNMYVDMGSKEWWNTGVVRAGQREFNVGEASALYAAYQVFKVMALNPLLYVKNRFQHNVEFAKHAASMDVPYRMLVQPEIMLSTRAGALGKLWSRLGKIAKHESMMRSGDKMSYNRYQSDPILNALWTKAMDANEFVQKPTQYLEQKEGFMKQLVDYSTGLVSLAEFSNRADDFMRYAMAHKKQTKAQMEALSNNGLLSQDAKEELLDDLYYRASMFAEMTNGKYSLVHRAGWEKKVAGNRFARLFIVLQSPFIRSLSGSLSMWQKAMKPGDMSPGGIKRFAGLAASSMMGLMLTGLAYNTIVSTGYAMLSQLTDWGINPFSDEDDGSAFVDSLNDAIWAEVRRSGKSIGFSYEDMETARSVIENGVISHATNTDFHWDEGVQSFSDPFILQQIEQAGKSLDKGEGWMEKFANLVIQQTAPTFGKRLAIGAAQLNANRYLDAELEPAGGAFGYGDFIKYVAMGRSLDAAVAQRYAFSSKNPLMNDNQKRNYIKKLVSLGGLTYKGHQGVTKDYLASAESELYKIAPQIHDEAMDIANSYKPMKAKSQDLLNKAVLDNETMQGLLESYAARNKKGFQWYLMNVGTKSKMIPEDAYLPESMNKPLHRYKNELKSLVNDYYNNMAAQIVLSKAIAQNGQPTQVKYVYQHLPAIDGGKIGSYPLDEQGYQYALYRMVSRWQESRYGKASQTKGLFP